MADPKRDDFYVGYLPLPKSHRTLLRIAVPVTMWIMAITAGLFAFTGPGWGSGTWDLSEERTWTGEVSLDPYPYLLTSEGPIPVVEMGKFGAERLSAFGGRTVQLRGYAIERAAGRMIELLPGAEAIEDRGPPAGSIARGAEAVEEVTLVGEVLDSKCFLGAMKPGFGAGHRACAALCVQGGIPPMLVVGTGEDPGPLYLLVDEDGSAANDRLWVYVGEPVEVSGTLENWNGIERVRVSGIVPATRG